jgi:hypothetical protein
MTLSGQWGTDALHQFLRVFVLGTKTSWHVQPQAVCELGGLHSEDGQSPTRRLLRSVGPIELEYYPGFA